jgi:hypothetical protein
VRRRSGFFRTRKILCVLCVLCGECPARAQDDFEIQVYDAETAARGRSGFELHLNAGSDNFSHFTLEPHVGLLEWLEAGAYFQTQLRPDGTFEYAGVKLRLKMRVPRRLRGFGMALNGEWSAEPSGMGGELRPIVDFEWKRLYVSVNPIVSFGSSVDFEPAAKVTVKIIPALALGAEWYGTATAGVERIFGVLDAGWGRLGLNVGAGYSFGDNQWIVKAIVSCEI